MLPELLDQIPPEQEIASVTAEGAFDTCECHYTIAARGAAAIIPPRKNPKPRSPTTPEQLLATRSCALRSPSGGLSGDDGATITAQAAKRPK